MAKWADFCISKLNLNENGFIDNVVLCEDTSESLSGEWEEQNRAWMVAQVEKGKTFCTIKKNKRGSWNKLGDVSYNNLIFRWYKVPKNLPKRKAFVSYYHHDDENYRIQFDHLFDDLITSKSITDGDIDSDTSDEYAKMLIQKEYLHDTTILIVLIGEKTKCRKHVDWEIYGALDYRVGDKYSGLLGLFLPSHPSYGSDNYSKSSIPKRLAANVESGYAILRDWTEDREKLQKYIELAIANREYDKKIENKSILQMKENECE